MALQWPDKDPNEILDYSIDWTNKIDTGDTISSSTWTDFSSGGLVKGSSTFSASLNITTIWVSGGTAGKYYTITNTIDTTIGRTMQQTVGIKIGEK